MSYLLYITEGICQKPWGKMKWVNDLKQVRTAASPGPGKGNEDWWRARLLKVAWSTTKRRGIDNPAPRKSTLPTGLSLLNWAGVASACNCRRTMQERAGSQRRAGSQVHRAEVTAGRERPAHRHSQGSCHPCIPIEPPLKSEDYFLYRLLSLSCVKAWALTSLLRAFFMQGNPLLTN